MALGRPRVTSVMRLEHVAIWTEDLARLTDFYSAYFGAIAGAKYINQIKGFESCFLRFESGARLELMKSSMLEPVKRTRGAQRMGLTHLAVSVGFVHRVDELTSRLRHDGFEVVDGPRHTGDGYYESVILDPDGNRIEITV